MSPQQPPEVHIVITDLLELDDEFNAKKLGEVDGHAFVTAVFTNLYPDTTNTMIFKRGKPAELGLICASLILSIEAEIPGFSAKVFRTVEFMGAHPDRAVRA